MHFFMPREAAAREPLCKLSPDVADKPPTRKRRPTPQLSPGRLLVGVRRRAEEGGDVEVAHVLGARRDASEEAGDDGDDGDADDAAEEEDDVGRAARLLEDVVDAALADLAAEEAEEDAPDQYGHAQLASEDVEHDARPGSEKWGFTITSPS